MNNTAHIAADFIWRWRFLLAGLCLLCSALAATQILSLGVSNSLEIWYPEDDPELLNYRQFQQTYGNDEIVVVAVSSDDGFLTDSGMELVGELTDRLLDVDGVATVTSLVTVPQSLSEVRGRLQSADGKTTALVLQMMSGEEFESRRHQILLNIKESIASYGIEPKLAGYGVVFDGLNEESTTGTTTLLIYAHGLMVVLLAFFFRKPGAVLVTLFAVGNATLWTMGLYVLLGQKLSMITMVLPTLVLVIGIADCVHLLRSVAKQDDSLEQRERVVRGLAAVIGPCLLTSVTTAAGFMALTTSGLPVVKTLGWFGGIGMLAAYATSMIICTAGLTWRGAEPKSAESRLDAVAVSLFSTATRYPRSVIAAFVLAAFVAVFGLTRLETDTNSIGYLKKTHQVRRDSDFIEANLGPYVPVEFTVTARGDILQRDKLDAIQRWQVAVTQMDAIGWSWSLLDALGIRHDERPSSLAMDTLRQRLERIRQFSPVTAAAMLAGNNELRISFGAPIMSAGSVRSLIEDIVSRADLPPDLELKAAGYSPLYTRIVDELVWSQVRGFSAAILLIVLLLGLAMRSWHRILLALPANAVPVALTLGLMGLTGIPLDVASATIATVILGLVVDDTVHILRPSAGRDISGSLQIAANRAGGTLLMTSIVLALGFLVLGLAEIRSVVWFGTLTSFAMIAAILTDLLLLPALATVADHTRGGHQVFHTQSSALDQAQKLPQRHSQLSHNI
jgi:predicted RND superfamily exporter protein